MKNTAILTALAEPWMIEPATLAHLERIVTRQNDPAAWLESLASRSEPSAVVSRAGRKMEGTRGVHHRDGIATIPVRGPIVRHATLFTEVCGGASVEALAADIQAAVDSSCTAIILEFDTPGGQVTGIGELAEQIRAHCQTKPIHAYVDGAACSAGYYLASACSTIVTAATGRLGSIGAIWSIPQKDRKPGADAEFISSASPLKNPDPMSEAGIASYQESVDAIASIFIRDVAKYRGVSEETVRAEFGQGGTFFGETAVARGMADQCCSYETFHRELSGQRGAARTQTAARAESSPTPGLQAMPSMWKRMWAKVDAHGAPEALSDEKPEGVTEPEAQAEPKKIEMKVGVTADTTHLDRQLHQAQAKIEELQAKYDAMLAQAKTAETSIADAAASFAQAMAASQKIVPAETAGLIEDYIQAATDDANSPMTAGTSRLDRFKARVEARPKHSLTTEQIGVTELPADAQVLPSVRGATPSPTEPTPQGSAMSESRRLYLMGLTQAGRDLLAAAKK